MCAVMPLFAFGIVCAIVEFVLHFINSCKDVNLTHTTSWHFFTKHIITTIYKKRDPLRSRVLFCEYGSHEVLNKYSSVVLVNVSGEGLAVRNACRCLNEWVADHAVAGLESNLGLEGARIDRT
jgi:hypothetical protein